MTTLRTMAALGAAINQESYEWLTDNLPELADAVQTEVNAGATPDEIRRFALLKTQRPALAMRLQQAAAYLAAAREVA